MVTRFGFSYSLCSTHFFKELFFFEITGQEAYYQHIEMVTLIPRLPLSAKSCAIDVSKTRQSEFIIADETPS